MLRRLSKFKLLFLMMLGLVIIPAFAASSAFAFNTTTGTELQSAYSAVQGGITGYWGMVAAIVIVALGLLGAWEMKKPVIFLAGIVAAVLIPNLPSVISALGACF